MEILSNLAWGMVVLALWGFWLAGWQGRGNGRPARAASLLPSIGIQLIALAMLSAVLLPVISVTDDLQASQNPAEVERTLSRNDRHLALAQPTHPLPLALALIIFSLRPLRLHTMAFLSSDELLPRRHDTYARTLWSRPPPAA